MDNLLLAISLAPAKTCQSVTVIPSRYALLGRFKLSSLERNRCPVCAGPSDRFAMESVIALPWNRCPVCPGKRKLERQLKDEKLKSALFEKVIDIMRDEHGVSVKKRAGKLSVVVKSKD